MRGGQTFVPNGGLRGFNLVLKAENVLFAGKLYLYRLGANCFYRTGDTASVQVNGHYFFLIIAVGELGTGRPLMGSVESYDTHEQRWMMSGEMDRRPVGFGLAVLNGLIYAICGFGQEHYWNTTQCFDHKTNSWSSGKVAAMLRLHCYFGLAALNSHLYAVGGDDGESRDLLY